MIVEHATHPQFLSNTYLVADGEEGAAFFIDAGGPVKPLIETAGRLGLEPTHVGHGVLAHGSSVPEGCNTGGHDRGRRPHRDA